MHYRDAKGGFTLTELLVSTAIFAILMTSIGALFVASLNAVKSGYQSQKVYEDARGTFNVIQRDLTTVFTSRDFGQYYQFYGNEYGMMMVGLLQLRDASGRDYTRIGRITYVIYPVVLRGGDNAFYVTEPFAIDYAKEVGVTDTGRAPDFHQTRGVRFAGNDPNSDAGSREVAICALVRYVEPGVSELDAYPFNWDDLIDETENNPEFPATSSPESLRSQLNDSLEVSNTLSLSPSNDLRILGRLDSARDQMFAAKKRDLWLKMLSCQKYWIPRLVGGQALLPNPWGRVDPNSGAVTERCWLRGGSTVSVVDPRDFVAVENIGVFTPQDYWTTWPLLAYRADGGYKPFFEFGRITADTSVDLMPFWNSNRQSYAGNIQLPNDGVDNDQDGLVDEPGERLVVAGMTDPAILLLDPNAYESDGRDNDADGQIDEPGETFVNPIEQDGLDNDGDGTIDEPGETIDSFNLPTDASVPGDVKRRDDQFAFVSAWEYAGAPDKAPILNKEPLVYEEVHMSTRSYK